MRKSIIFIVIIFVIAANSFSNEISYEELFNTGLKYHTEKKYKEAEKYYKESYTKKEDSDTAYNLGVLFEEINDKKQAEKYYKEVISLPLYPTMTNEQHNRVIKTLKQVLE